ncbi:hypothetical protein [Palleronia sp.]|uniref:hypothetical protein n=1 Tax=Palleronia sp. TaxID=1940284 RepID=UPI0035C86392
MKIDLKFFQLDGLRQKMGASLSEWTLNGGGLSPRKKLLEELERGVEIDLDEVSGDMGGLLTYKGEQVLLYIKDTRSSRWTLENEPERSRRFHVADCSTLQSMRAEGRFERYVATNRSDDLFLVDWWDQDSGKRGETEAALKVCKNCLRELNWRGYDRTPDRLMLPGGGLQARNEIWESFHLSEFLGEYSTFFREMPSRTEATAKLDVYVKDWPSISEKRRRAMDWTCQKCRVRLASVPGVLHTHHRNGVKTDNNLKNLEVLCACCHAEQPYHQHMKIPENVRAKILDLRKLQGCK